MDKNIKENKKAEEVKDTNDYLEQEDKGTSIDDIENAPEDLDELFSEPPTLDLDFDEEPTDDELKLEEMDVDRESIEWFCNLRKFGGCYHSGFGMGFERLLIYLTGVENIRDVIPFPRTPGNCEF